jgi:hypothetical protein
MKRTFYLAAAALAIALIAPAANSQQRDHSGLAARIEGTWILKIQRVTQGDTFSALQSFTAGGVTLATGTIDRTPPPPISPLYGSWRRIDHRDRVACGVESKEADCGSVAMAISKPTRLFS